MEMANTEFPEFDPEIVHLIDEAAHLLEEGTRVPLTGRAMVDSEGLLALLEHMRQAVPEDVRRARRVLEESERLVADAEAQAQQLLEKARAEARQLAGESEITQQATALAEETLVQARGRAREMREGARAYADEVLARAEAGLARLLEELRTNRAQLGPPA